MANVSVKFNTQHYHLACQDGEGERLSKLAEYVEDKARQIAGTMGSVSDFRLLLMTAISLADELDEGQGGKPVTQKDARNQAEQMENILTNTLKRVEDITREVVAEG